MRSIVGLRSAGLLAKLQAGDVIRERLTVVEGIAFRELRALLAAQTQLKQDSARMSFEELLKAIGASETHPEGLFAPETYVYDPDVRSGHLPAGVPGTDETAAGCVGGRKGDLPYATPYEALTMASIIEKETGQASERAMIAGFSSID